MFILIIVLIGVIVGLFTLIVVLIEENKQQSRKLMDLEYEIYDKECEARRKIDKLNRKVKQLSDILKSIGCDLSQVMDVISTVLSEHAEKE
jgi:hypothetical protein